MKLCIKPYHVFHHRGNAVVINVDDMTSRRVDEATAAALQALAADPERPAVGPAREMLTALGLLRDADSPRPPDHKPEPEPITTIALFVTQTCNLRCIYCYGDGGSFGSGGSMSLETARRAVDWLIDQAGDMKDLVISFFGGEPLMSFPVVRDVVAYALARGKETDKRFAFGLSTNGILLDEEMLAFLKKHEVSLLVSLDGPKGVHDAQRPFPGGEGSHAVVLPKIRRLLEVLPDAVGRATVLEATDPSTVRAALLEAGFRKMILTVASPSLFGGRSGPSSRVFHLDGFRRMVEAEAEEWIDGIRGRDWERLALLRGTGRLWDAVATLMNGERSFTACYAGISRAGISCSGGIYLCHRFVGLEDYRLGSVFTRGLERDAYLEDPLKVSRECARCFSRHFCAGGCKHMNAGASGSIVEPCREMCDLSRRQLELAAYVVSLLDAADREFLVEKGIVPQKPCPFDFP